MAKQSKKTGKVKRRKKKPKNMSDYLYVRGLTPSRKRKPSGNRYGVSSG